MGDEFRQVEHLGRPGINELLLLSDPFATASNATSPSLTGIPSAELIGMVGEAKTALRSFYLGICLLDGELGFSAMSGLHPAGIQCQQVGDAMFEADGKLKVTVALAAQKYADRVFGQLIPDVLRIDVETADSRYETLCSGLADRPLFCGGRSLRDDVVDITLDFLFNGLATCTTGIGAMPGNQCGAPNQLNALVGDGVVFDNANNAANVGSRQNGAASNPNQGHPALSAAFPYAAPPI